MSERRTEKPNPGPPAPQDLAIRQQTDSVDRDGVDRDGVDSFPASDPPSHWAGGRRRGS